VSQLSFGDMLSEKKKEEPWFKGRPLSHSSISTYQLCPQKWKFRYIDKIPQKPRSYFSFGKSVHSALEFFFSKIHNILPSSEDVLVNYKANWIREGYETAAQEKWFYNEGERILKGFVVKHQNVFSQVKEVEYKFTIEVEGVPLLGYIDRIDETPDNKLIIVDYKTGKAFDKSRVRSDPQLTLYQMAVKESFGKPVEKLTFYHLNSLTPITVLPHSEEKEKAFSQVVLQSARGITEKKYDPNPDEKGHCRWCDYLQVSISSLIRCASR